MIGIDSGLSPSSAEVTSKHEGVPPRINKTGVSPSSQEVTGLLPLAAAVMLAPQLHSRN